MYRFFLKLKQANNQEDIEDNINGLETLLISIHKKIEKEVLEKFNTMPDNVQCAVIDIDVNFDVFAFLKTKKMFAGIPAILCYQKENDSYIPDEIHNNSNKDELKEFFDRCDELL